MSITGSQRHLFDIPDDVTYLNAAYLTPQPGTVRRAGLGALDRADAPWTIAVDDFFAPVERLRGLFADLIGADAEGVAIIPSVSYGAGIAAANLKVGPGRTVVVLEEQFPANVYPWRSAVTGGGGEMVTVARPSDGMWTPSVLETIDAQTAVVAVPNVHWTDGSLLDLAQVGAAARQVGAALVIDASQSLGAMPFDAGEIRPDFVFAAGYKWLLGPFGLGYLWVSPDYRQGTPLEQGWIVRAGSEDFAGLVDYRDQYAPGARRYDVGERSSFQLIPMAMAAIEQLLDWGVDHVATALQGITDAIERAADERGLLVVPPQARGPHLIGVRAASGLPTGVAAELAARRVYVSIRGDSIRVAPHLYNDQSDVDRLFSVLDEVL
ncbi:MAG: aminotransferase class V-fold PLP-dependent enzyme [Acidimicrobiia bacterium]|nr:MAG: aminotransferase class V-fold PLP-dependent enzyme [Acidimicrobiia bacterium]